MGKVLTGIDPGAGAIKIIQGSMSGPIFKLSRVISIPIEVSDRSDVESDILTELQGLSDLKGGTARVGVTGRDLMVRYTTVPPVPLWRLKMLMDFEVLDMAQASGDELTADYNILNREDADDETVLVSLVKSFFLQNRLRALSGSGVKVQAASPNCVALFNSFLAFGEMEDEEYTFLLDIGERNVEMAIQKDGDLVFARNLMGGGEAFTKAIAEAFSVGVPKAEELKRTYGNVTPRGRATFSSSEEEKVANSIIGVAGQLAGMVQSTINFCRAQSGISDLAVGRVVVSGGGANLTGLTEYLEENLRIRTQRFEPDAGLDISGLSGEDLVTFDEDRGAFACALGLARMNEDPDAFLIDIVPDDIKKKRRFMARTLYMFLAAGAAALFLVLLWSEKSTQAEDVAKIRKSSDLKARRAVRTRKKFEEKAARAEDLRDQVSRLGWESRGGTYLMRAQGIVQDNAPESIWVRNVGVQVRSVPKPGEASSKKNNVEKVIVTVDGNIRQLGERVTTTYNKFIESMRTVKAAPVIETTKRPSDAGGEFQFTIDFSGWPGDEAADDEEDDS